MVEKDFRKIDKMTSFLIKNNGYWYEAWYEVTDGKRVPKKRPIKGANGKTLKVIEGRFRDNRSEAEAIFSSLSGPIVDADITIEQGIPIFEQYLLSKGKQPLTLKTYLQNIRILKEHLPLKVADHSLAGINAVINSLPFKPITKQGYAKSLSRFYDVLLREGRIKSNPMTGFEWTKDTPQPRPLKEPEIKRLVAASVGLSKETGLEYEAFMMFALQVGARLNEYINLRWEYLDWKGGTYTICESEGFRPKHGMKRTLVVPKKSLELLAKMPKRSEYIFCKPDGRKYDNHFPREFVNNIFKVAEVKDCDLDRIRETFVSWSFACGRSHKSLKLHLGHKRYEEMEAYDGIVNNPSKFIKSIFGTVDY